jgi:hypothetical protein
MSSRSINWAADRVAIEEDCFFLEKFEWLFGGQGLILTSLEAAGAI